MSVRETCKWRASFVARDVRAAQCIVAAGQVVGTAELVAQVLVDPQDEVLRGFVESRRGLLRAPRISGPEDLLDRGENRALSIAVPEGLRPGGPDRVFADREGLEVVDRGPQISRGPFDDHIKDFRGDVDAFLGGDRAKYVFHGVIVNRLKFDGLA